MEKIIGPTISVSTSGFYITGNANDATSGVAKYCYNTSDTPSKYEDIPTIAVGAYSVPQYHVQATGTYRCHVLDTAGNHNFDTTLQITYYTYHCNYCNQNINDFTYHYRCPYGHNSSCTYSQTCRTNAACRGTYSVQLSTYNISGNIYGPCVVCR